MSIPATQHERFLMYKWVIDIVTEDLNLQEVTVDWMFLKRIKGCVGECVSRLGGRYNIIKIDVSQEEKEIILTIMHELRHAWQTYKGIWTDATEYNKFYVKGYWNNKEYRFKKKNIDEAPWELDAAEYEEEYDRLFGKKEVYKRGGITVYKIGA